MLRHVSSNMHKKEMSLTWGNAKEIPTFFNHYLDIYYQLFTSRKTDFLSRGVFNQLFLDPANIVLELGCGDGYNTEVFYSPMVKEVYAIDISQDAIGFAKSYHYAQNITYQLADAVTHYPLQTSFDRVICDCFLEQLDAKQQEELFKKIKSSLSKRGICLGSTVLKTDINYLTHNKNEFTEDSFVSFTRKFFKYSFTINKTAGNKNYKYFALSNEPFTRFKLIEND